MNTRCRAESGFGSPAKSLALGGVIAVAMAACSPRPAPLQADLVVLSRDPLSMPAADLLDLEVVETVSRGATVFLAQISQ